MKHLNKVLGTAFALMATGASYGCNLKAQEKENTVLVTQSIVEKPNKHFVKIALLLDTSNSMDGLINQAKAQLWDIVNEFTHAKCGNDTRPMLQIALYEYGNDNLSSREGYICQVLGFSDDLDEISEKLFSLTTNGGEEYCGEVIQTSLKQLDWGKNSAHVRVLRNCCIFCLCHLPPLVLLCSQTHH